MKLRVHSQGFDLTPAIAARVHKRLDTLQARFAEELINIDVYLKDLNGPKGGYDKQVIIRVHLRHRAPFSISTTHTDLYKAIDVCARRCARSVNRNVSRQRLIRRRGLHQIATANANL